MRFYLLLAFIVESGLIQAQLSPKDVVKKIEVYFKTSNDVLSGTDNDVWFDIGPKAWKITDGFKKGTIKQFVIDNPNKVSYATGDPDVVLLVEDIKFIRIEKKGIKPCDLTPGIEFSICNEIGGLSNAPDHFFEIFTPDIVTPAGQVAMLKNNIATANRLLGEFQQGMNKAKEAYQDIANKIDNIEKKIEDLAKKVANIPEAAAKIHNEILELKKKLNLTTMWAVERVCETLEKKERKWLGVLLGFGWVVVGSEIVCRNKDVISKAWTDLNNAIIKLEQEEIKIAGEAGAKILTELIELQIQIAGFKNTRLLTDFHIKVIEENIAIQRHILSKANEELGELEKFIREKLPLLSFDLIPRLNQWKLEWVTVFINGIEFKHFGVNKRFKKGNSVWMTAVDPKLTPAELFLNGLRVNGNSKGKTLDNMISAVTTPFFKDRGISSWEDGPILHAGVIGTLIHDANVGTDGFVSLDIQLSSVMINDIAYLLNGRRPYINNARFIRVEYLRVKTSGEVDNSFNNLKGGQKVWVRGYIKRDLDRHSFFEIHADQNIQIVIMND